MALSLVERLAELTDPRSRHGRQYPMVGLLTLCLVAILAGHTAPEAIAQFGRLRQKRLGHALGFKNGNMPCANTIAGLLRKLDADHLDRIIGAWLSDRHPDGWEHTLHYSGPRGHFPLDLRLHLPESWTDDPTRLNAAGVPEVFHAHRTKGAIALELLDRACAEGLAGGTVVADLGSGGALVRAGLTEHGLRYVLGVQADCLVFPQEPSWVHPPRTGRRGPDPRRWVLAPDSPQPVSVETVAKGLKLRRVSWRDGTKGKLSARFGWARIWPGQEWKKGSCAHTEQLWLLVEARDDGQVQYALSNLSANTPLFEAVRLWKQRWRVEQGHQQMKEELGLDHFEGRSWRGFHHHAAMVLLAYGFSLLEQSRPRPEPVGSGKKGARSRG